VTSAKGLQRTRMTSPRILNKTLEPESELYNSGIVDMSHRYAKTYVGRPQFFLPIISVLRNAALGSLQYK
jgi:hypothetical protein